MGINKNCVLFSLPIAVQIILVTDFLALLTEKDQKYHLATLQDLQVGMVHVQYMYSVLYMYMYSTLYMV